MKHLEDVLHKPLLVDYYDSVDIRYQLSREAGAAGYLLQRAVRHEVPSRQEDELFGKV